MTERQSNYMHLYSGDRYFPFEPLASEVKMIDIAHSLASKARYNGHTRFPIWVAQHSVYTALVSVPGADTYQQRYERLMHDAAEFAVGDLIRPLKSSPEFQAPFKLVEERNEKVIAEALSMAHPHGAHIKVADEMVTAAEVRQIVRKNAGVTFDKPLHDDSIIADVVIEEWTWRQAKEAFLSLANALNVARNLPEFEFVQIPMPLTHILERLKVPSDSALRSLEESVNND